MYNKLLIYKFKKIKLVIKLVLKNMKHFTYKITSIIQSFLREIGIENTNMILLLRNVTSIKFYKNVFIK